MDSPTHQVQRLILAIPGLSREETISLYMSTTALSTALMVHLLTLGAGTDNPHHLIKAPEAAELLGISTRTLFRHADEYPFTYRIGVRNIRFHLGGILQWIATHPTGA